MNKFLKLFLISLISFTGIVLIGISIIVLLVFTPSKMTAIVNKQLQQMLTCDVRFEGAELTFFSTFPQLGIDAKGLTLLNPIDGAPSDTLLHLAHVKATINAKAFIQNNEVVINGFNLEGGVINAFINENGISNFDVILPDTAKTDTASFSIPKIDIQALKISDIKLAYSDAQSRMSAFVSNLQINLKGKYLQGNASLNGNIAADSIAYEMKDSTSMKFRLAKPKLKLSGNLTDKLADLAIGLGTPQMIFKIDNDVLLSSAVKIDFPDIKYILSDNKLEFAKSSFAVDKQQLLVQGAVSMPKGSDMDMRISIDTKMMDIEELLKLLPQSYAGMLKGITLKGNALLNADIDGVYNDSLMPLIKANIHVEKGVFAYKGLPYTLSGIEGKLVADIDLSEDAQSLLTIENVALKTRNTSAAISGKVSDLTGNRLLDLKINGMLDLVDVMPMIPDSMNMKLSGKINPLVLSIRTSLDNLAELNFDKIQLDAKGKLLHADIVYNDSLLLKSSVADIGIKIPVQASNKYFKEVMQVSINSDEMNVEMTDFFTTGAPKLDLKLGLSDFMDKKQPLSISCEFSGESLDVKMDTIAADIKQPEVSFVMSPSEKNPLLSSYRFDISGSALNAQMGKTAEASTRRLKITGELCYDEQPKNIFAQWNPDVKLELENAAITTAQLKQSIDIPKLKLDIRDEMLYIDNVAVRLDSTDLTLKGTVNNIAEYLDNKGLLKADLDLESEHMNINQLMGFVSGFGAKDSAQTAAMQEPVQTGSDEPFMVPWGIDVSIHTRVKNALAGDTPIEHIGGTLIIKDGVMVLEQMGFTCDAAKMQLTAIYRSSRKNHLFAGIDFHLLDIEIDKLIDMFPEIDTIIPMLSSFNGKAEFHMAGESYLKSNYDVKWSTLRGSAALEGRNLVILDSKTFSKISNMLLFKKKTENIVDSMSVEMTLFKKEVDLYPFLLAMDKYKVVVAGRYNLDNNYNAHLETLSPLRLGLDVNGNSSDLKFKLAKTRYADMYIPEKQNAMQKQILELKKLIADALKANVKEHPEYLTPDFNDN